MLLEKHQRRLCRAFFLIGCVLPTLAVVAWAAARTAPAYRGALLSAAGEALGVRVACDRLRSARPGEYTLERVRLTDPASGRLLARCDRLRLRHSEGAWRFSAGRVEAPLASASRLARLLETGLNAEGRAALLVLSGPGSVREYAGVRLRLGDEPRTDERGPGRGLSLESDGLYLSANRWNDRSGPVTRLTLDCQRTPTPCGWLPIALLDGLVTHGEGAPPLFRGRFETTLTGDCYANHGAATGEVELAEGESNGSRWASGVCRLRRAEWVGERVVRLDGRLELRDGRLARPVVLGLHHALRCDAFPGLYEWFTAHDDDSSIPFTQLACDLELDEQGVTIDAGCGEFDGAMRGGAVAHAVLESEGKPLLKEPSQRPLPAASLVRALWHGAPLDLPSSAGAQRLARVLPAR